MRNILILLFLIKYSFTFAQNVDLTSIDEFFKITEILKKGEEISKKQWSQFEESSAYSIFSQNKDKHIINIVKSSIQDVFGSPGNKNSKKANDMLEILITANYEDINNNYFDLKTFRDNYNFELLISEAKLRLQSFLGCEMLDSSVKWKPVYFLFLTPDGKDMDNAIVIDFNMIYKMTEEQRVNFVAHEFFHVYRSHFENHDFNYANDINFMFDMIANEGIADQIDKYMGYEQYYSTVSDSKELAKEFAILYRNAEKDIEYFQTTIIQYAKKQIDKKTCIDRLLDIYKYNGHALGFYISNQIIKAGLKDEMIKEFHNPYEFYKLYNLALYKNKGISLNDDFLIFLRKEIEQYY